MCERYKHASSKVPRAGLAWVAMPGPDLAVRVGLGLMAVPEDVAGHRAENQLSMVPGPVNSEKHDNGSRP